MTITILLAKPVARGAHRRLTKREVDHIRGQRTSVRPTTGPAWRIERSDADDNCKDGYLSLRFTQANGEGCTYAIIEVVPPTYDELVAALRMIGAQSIADDWTKEQAFDFMRLTARDICARV